MTGLTSYPSVMKSPRDVLILRMLNGHLLVIGCDSAGGIGPKPLDKVKVDGYTLGKFTSRVALMEVLATGARPVALVNTLSVEMEPTGGEILRGVKDEAAKAGLDTELAVTGSYEKNIVTEQTGIGVTVLGLAKESELKIGTAQPGDAIVSIGLPKVGDEVVETVQSGKEKLLANVTDVIKLLTSDFVHEVLPVGSRGIATEAKTLASGIGCVAMLTKDPKINIAKSAGPSTVVLAAVPKGEIDRLGENFPKKPINVIGECRS